MPKGYPPEFRRRVLELLKAGRSVAEVASDLGVSRQAIYNWRRQEPLTRHQVEGEHADPAGARWEGDKIAVRTSRARLFNRDPTRRRSEHQIGRVYRRLQAGAGPTTEAAVQTREVEASVTVEGRVVDVEPVVRAPWWNAQRAGTGGHVRHCRFGRAVRPP